MNVLRYAALMVAVASLVAAIAWNANELRYGNCLREAESSVPPPVLAEVDFNERLSGKRRRQAQAKRVALISACDRRPW
jgi:hypothetical protein